MGENIILTTATAIALRNLPSSANPSDIHQFFQPIKIPANGLKVIGGDFGEALIYLRSIQDAHAAMQKDGCTINGSTIKLQLMTDEEFKNVAESAKYLYNKLAYFEKIGGVDFAMKKVACLPIFQSLFPSAIETNNQTQPVPPQHKRNSSVSFNSDTMIETSDESSEESEGSVCIAKGKYFIKWNDTVTDLPNDEASSSRSTSRRRSRSKDRKVASMNRVFERNKDEDNEHENNDRNGEDTVNTDNAKQSERKNDEDERQILKGKQIRGALHRNNAKNAIDLQSQSEPVYQTYKIKTKDSLFVKPKDLEQVINCDGITRAKNEHINETARNVEAEQSLVGCVEKDIKDCIVIIGMLNTATNLDVVEYLNDVGVVPQRIGYQFDVNGIRTGVCYCRLYSEKDAVLSLKKDCVLMNGRMIFIKVISRGQMESFECFRVPPVAPLNSFANFRFPPPIPYSPAWTHPGIPYFPSVTPPPFCFPPFYPWIPVLPPPPPPPISSTGYAGREFILTLKNIPYSTTVTEIVNFFDGYQVNSSNVTIIHCKNGRAAGCAMVTMKNESLARKALVRLKNRLLGNRCVKLHANF